MIAGRCKGMTVGGRRGGKLVQDASSPSVARMVRGGKSEAHDFVGDQA